MATNSPQRRIFRERALQVYMRQHQPDVLPRLLAPGLFLFCWFLLALLLCLLIGFLIVVSTFVKG